MSEDHFTKIAESAIRNAIDSILKTLMKDTDIGRSPSSYMDRGSPLSEVYEKCVREVLNLPECKKKISDSIKLQLDAALEGMLEPRLKYLIEIVKNSHSKSQNIPIKTILMYLGFESKIVDDWIARSEEMERGQ